MRKLFLVNLFMAVLIIAVVSLNGGAPASAPAAAAVVTGDRFVSPEGSDRHPGTEEEPWKTIQKAARSVGPGSTVHIKAGVYYERINIEVSGTSAEQPVLFRPYEKDKVVIDGSRSSSGEQAELIRISDQSFVHLVGLELVNNLPEDKSLPVAGIGVWGEGEGVEIRDCRIRQIGHESAAAGAGVSAAIAFSGDVEGFQVTGNDLRENGAVGIDAGAGTKDGLIAYNTCTENDLGIRVANDTAGKATGGIVVRDNLIYGNRSCGIQAGGSKGGGGWTENCSFLNNTLYGNGAGSQGRGEIHIGKSRELQFLSNIVYTGAGNLAVTTEKLGEESVYNITFNHNLYYGPGGSRGLRFAGVNTGAVGLNMWTQKTGQDKSSRIADPRFADSAGGDFRLQQNSPAVDFGDPAYRSGEGETDFAGASRIKGKGVDCGAFEF